MHIEIALSSYDDIFSDFDIREYRSRQLSRDFLDELRIRMEKRIDKSKTRIIMIIDRKERNIKYEKLIVKRLKAFFEERYLANLEKRRKNIITAIILGALGIGLLLVANFLSQHIGSLYGDFLLIPSWYLQWSSLEKVLGNSEEIGKKLKYYRILSDSLIVFNERKS